MAKRKLLKDQDRSKLVGIPVDEDSLIRHYSLSLAYRLEIKQSAGDLKLMADLMLTVPQGCKVYSAVDALLYPSFAIGCHGTIAANPAAVPGVCLALWNAMQKG
jgi:dihydrodipicolinate synthase/N-acetylneuraminate lyase